MSTTRELHSRAMEEFDQAMLAAKGGDNSRALYLLGRALRNEQAAADSVRNQFDLEPTRSVLHRSAASLALRVGDVASAKHYIERALDGSPPSEIREELAALNEQVLTLEAETTDYRLRAPSGVTRVQKIIRGFTAAAPVNIIGLSRALGCEVLQAKLADDVSGEIYRDLYRGGSSGYTIRVNTVHAAVRKRFTVAHELAHFLRHRDRIQNRLVDDRMYRSRLGSTREREANTLASQLLIPRKVLKEFRVAGINDPEELAARFKVSLQAMKLRLRR